MEFQLLQIQTTQGRSSRTFATALYVAFGSPIKEQICMTFMKTTTSC